MKLQIWFRDINHQDLLGIGTHLTQSTRFIVRKYFSHKISLLYFNENSYILQQAMNPFSREAWNSTDQFHDSNFLQVGSSLC